MPELLIAKDTQEPDEELTFDFLSPEDVLIELVGEPGATSWDDVAFEYCHVLNGKDEVVGAATYEADYGGNLEYTIQQLIDFPGLGWFVVTGITGNSIRGDGWTTDDDMDFFVSGVRTATPDEIAKA